MESAPNKKGGNGGVDYSGHVESYICQHDGPQELGLEVSWQLRTELESARPIQTVADVRLWFYRVNRHLRENGVPYEQMAEMPFGFKG